MRFVADGMLGSFARWLRLLGYEVNYVNDATDERLMEVANAEGRILLTGDVELYRRALARGIETYLIRGRTEPERLANMAKRFGIKLEVDPTTSRCPSCNSPIRRAEKTAVERKVPPKTLRIYEEFWMCEGCEKVYWQGSHWKKMGDVLAKAKRVLESQRS